MSINFEKALGSAERALLFRSQRAEVLSNNIANADTPNFKARDLDFSAVLASQTEGGLATPFSLKTTNPRHIAVNELASDIHSGALLYSTPNQPSIDQNTVDQRKRTGITGCVTAASYAATTRRSHWRAASAAASAHP